MSFQGQAKLYYMESKNENLLEVKMIMWKAAWKMENHEDEAGLRGAQNTE